MKGTAKIVITADSPEQIQELANCIQYAVNSISIDDLTKLLMKVKENPSIIKTALKFI